MTEVAHVLGWNPVRGETKSGSWETEGENALRGCRSTGIDRYELIGSSQHPYGAGAVIIPILQMRLSDLFKATQLASGGSQVPWGRLGPLPTAWPPGGLGARDPPLSVQDPGVQVWQWGSWWQLLWGRGDRPQCFTTPAMKEWKSEVQQIGLVGLAGIWKTSFSEQCL